MNDDAPETPIASGDAAPAASRSRAILFSSFLDRPWHPAVTLSLAAGALVLSAVALFFPPASFLAPPRPAPRPPEIASLPRVEPDHAALESPSDPGAKPAHETKPAARTIEAAPHESEPATAAAHAPVEEDAPREHEEVEEDEPRAEPAGDALSDADAVRTAARREFVRAAEAAASGDDEAEAWLYLSEIRRGAGDEAGAAEALRRRDAILAERSTRAAFLEQLRIVSEKEDEKTLLAAPEPLVEPVTDGDFKRARARLYAMLARSGDLSGKIGAVAPDVSMAIADTYRDEALRALEGRKADAPPKKALLRDEPAPERAEGDGR